MTPILDSRKLLAFSTLARVGSFTLAARELFITQSAVSHAIKSLELELECRLFDRLGRSVKLTQAGEQLLEHAQRILAEMGAARADLAELPK
jgi:DNA-binding transcriptional LysR family regulator